MKIKKYALVLIVVLFPIIGFLAFSEGDDYGSIRGNFYPPNSEATISLKGSNLPTNLLVDKSDDGTFVIDDVPSGVYDLVITSLDSEYPLTILNIEVEAGEEIDIGEVYVGELPFYQTEIEGVDWDGNVIEAVGIGRPPEDETDNAKGRLLAERAARSDAYRNLLKIAERIKTDPDKSIGDLVEQDGISRVELTGFIEGAQIVETSILPDGSVRVKAIVPLRGVRSLSEFIYRKGL